VLLLGIRHRRQHKADCLAACSAMVLEYLGITLNYDHLLRLIETTDQGTAFFNIKRLEALGLFVELGKYADIAVFEKYIDLGLPVITSVKTIGWQHWAGEETRHAVVVVGIDLDSAKIYIHDPFFGEPLIEMPLIEYEIGWDEQDRSYAIIGLTKPETG